VKIEKCLIRQIVLYGIIGGGSAFLDFMLFTLMYKQFGMNEYLVNVISVHAGIAMSFILNRKFNFKKTDRVLFRAVSFYLTGLFGLALSQGLLWFGGVLLLPVVMVKFTSIFIVAAVQFVINKQVAFNK
jgi:putative flippase GtrA